MGWYDKNIVRVNQDIIINGELNVYLHDVIKYIQENNIQHIGFDEVNLFYDNELSADEVRVLLNQLLALKVLSGNGSVILDSDILKVEIEKHKEKWCQERRKKEEWNRKLDEKIKKKEAAEAIALIPEDEESTNEKEDQDRVLYEEIEEQEIVEAVTQTLENEETPRNSSCGCLITTVLVSIILYIQTNDYLGIAALVPIIVIVVGRVVVSIKDKNNK